MNHPRISVLIGTRNRPEILKHCLKIILGQDYIDFEVLILDDASDSCNVCDSIQNLADSRVRCFRASEPLGVAGGRNRLMELATGDVFCVIDDDASFNDSNALTKIADVFARYPDVGIVAVKVIDQRGGKTKLLVPFPKMALIRCPSLINEEREVSYFLGTCHAIRREVIEVCGPYQPNLMYGEEELDLSYRVIQAGFKIRYVPSIIVHHYPQGPVVQGYGSVKKNPELFYHVRNRIFLAKKHLPFPFVFFYLTFWLLRYLAIATGSGAFPEFAQGIAAGIRLTRQTKRTPLNQEAIKYLRKHFGRLWY